MTKKGRITLQNSYICLPKTHKKEELNKSVFEYLRTSGVAKDELQKVKLPAGIDIQAKTSRNCDGCKIKFEAEPDKYMAPQPPKGG